MLRVTRSPFIVVRPTFPVQCCVFHVPSSKLCARRSPSQKSSQFDLIVTTHPLKKSKPISLDNFRRSRYHARMLPSVEGREHKMLPIIESTAREMESTEERRRAVQQRRQERMDFWMSVMRADEDISVAVNAAGYPILPSFNDRLRASELAAKVDGDFVERKEINVTTTYREMIMSRAGRLVELEPPQSSTTVIDMDLAEGDSEDEYDSEYAVAQ